MEVLVNKVFENAVNTPDKLALAYKDEQLTYSRLANTVVNFSDGLKELGVSESDHVFISAVSRPETVVAYLATTLLGAIAVFLDKNATAELTEKLYDKIDGNLLLTDKKSTLPDRIQTISLHEIYEEAKNGRNKELYQHVERDSERISEILFTSGTTGLPKGVMLSYRAIWAILQNNIIGTKMQENDVVLVPLPLHHSFALRKVRASLTLGATVILQNGFTFAKEVEKNINDYHCNTMICVPASLELMIFQMKESFKVILGNLKRIEVGSGSISLARKRDLISSLINTDVINTWGSTETGGVLFLPLHDSEKNNTLDSVGSPIDSQKQAIIVDAKGSEILTTRDNPGKLMIKGDMVFSGYYKDEENTKKSLVDGCYLSNDLVYMKDGYIYMLGRADDLINVGGEKVYPIEVENAASLYDGIAECACVGTADPEGITGQVPAIFIVKKETYNESEFISFLKKHLTKYQLPKIIRYIDALPRNSMQKIDRKVLRAML